MTRQIKLKLKYRWKPRGRFFAVGDDNLKKVTHSHSQTTVIYNPREHVLYVHPSGKKRFLHGADARRVLGSNSQNSGGGTEGELNDEGKV